MEKDRTLLAGVSKFFTEETLRDILCKSSGKTDAAITGWTFAPPAAKGDYYLSQVDKMTIHGESNGEKMELKLVVKSLPKNLGRRKTFRSADFFRNEITFYTQVVPEFEKFIESKGLDKSASRLLQVPPCLSTLADGENDYIALEDMGAHGFTSMSRLECLTLAQMTILLKTLANFHAVSFAYKDQHAEKFQKLAHQLRETYFTDEHWDWYKNFQAISNRVTIDALSKEYPDHPALAKFTAYEPSKKRWDMSVSFCRRWHAPTSVVNPGDTWTANFLVKNVGDGADEQAILLDFQLARVASPVLDLSYLIYVCCDKPMLDDHYDEMLRIYHSTLASSIKTLGSYPEEVYPWFLFLQEVKEQSIHGLNFAIEAVPGCLLDESEAYDLDLIDTDAVVDIADVWNVQNIKTSAGRRRLADLVIHAYDQGYL